MGLLSWLFGSKGEADQAEVMVVDITNGPDTYSVDIVGESHYQEHLEHICGGRADQSQRLKVEAYLIPENDNPHDALAVRIVVQDQTVGHLDRETARSFRQRLDEFGVPGLIAKCNAIVVGGWDRGDRDRGHFGVKLDLPTG